jgi:hypothetical protein
MKLQQILTEETLQYEVKRIKNSNREELQKFADFYNIWGKVKWNLTPQRIISKLGSKGRLWGLYIKGTNDFVGSIGIKDVSTSTDELGEIGYIAIEPEHRGLPNVMMLFKEVIRYSRKFDNVYATTNTAGDDAKKVNGLLDRTGKAEKILKIRSPYSRNLLYVWSIKTSRNPNSIDVIKAHFREHILMEL